MTQLSADGGIHTSDLLLTCPTIHQLSYSAPSYHSNDLYQISFDLLKIEKKFITQVPHFKHASIQNTMYVEFQRGNNSVVLAAKALRGVISLEAGYFHCTHL